MATPVIMPRQGQSVESCILTKWHKGKGETVKAGEQLFTFETDKAVFHEEAPVDGVLLEVYFGEDADVPVLATVCVIGAMGENTEAFRPSANGAPERAAATETVAQPTAPDGTVLKTAPEASVTSAPPPEESGRLAISPRARHLAEKAHADLRAVRPSGPAGRIIERDIKEVIDRGQLVTAAAQPVYAQLPASAVPQGTGLGGRVTTSDLAGRQPAAGVIQSTQPAQPVQSAPTEARPDYEDRKLSNIRKTIAKAMQQSLANTAQLTLHTSFDAGAILAYRREIKANRERLGLADITLNDIILYAVSRALLDFPELNAHFLGDGIRLFHAVHLGVAVDTERGLMVPTIFNASAKSLNELAREAKELIATCQSGSIDPDRLSGGTFTVTNLGTLCVEYFTPILNPPQTGILGVNTIIPRVREEGGQLATYPSMALSLTFDHRALDGAPAARFLQALKTYLENFAAMLAR